MIKIVYTILLGVILALFVGLGIEAFYPTEKYPDQPAALTYAKSDGGNRSVEEIQAQKDFDKTMKDFQTRNALHSRNVSMMAIGFSIIYMILSLAVLTRKEVFANGFLLGSLFTLFYGMIRGFEADDNKFRFIIVSVGLIIALTLGYFKFLRQKDN